MFLYRSALVMCLVGWASVQTVFAQEKTDLRAQRVAAIKQCAHGADQTCPHGRMWHVDNQSANASDDNDGSAAAPFMTIDKAAQVALPGDTVLVSKGVYREHVSPGHAGYDVAHMITYLAEDRLQAVIKGSDLWRPTWRKVTLEAVSGQVWQADLDPALFTYDFPIENFNPFLLHDAHRVEGGRGPDQIYLANRPAADDAFPPVTRGMIFKDGRRLAQARSLTDFAAGAESFFVAADGQSIYARFSDDELTAHRFEITTREQAFAPKSTGVGFIRVKGFVMEHGATTVMFPQYGLVSPSSVWHGGENGWHWIIEDNIIRLSNGCGLDIGMGYWGPGRSQTRSSISEPIGEKPRWSHWIRNNAITDNGQAGIWSIGLSGNSIIEYNRIERNAWHNQYYLAEAAGLKMHGVEGAVIRGNLVRDNDGFGIWLDICGGNNRITQNLVLGNLLAGVFVEAMWGHTLVDNNIVAFTRPLTHGHYGDGFYNHQASYVTFAHNLAYANTGHGYRCRMWGRTGANTFPDGHTRVSHNRVLNNIAFANGRGAVSLPIDQTYCKDNMSDYNLLWGLGGEPLFELGKALLPRDQMGATLEAAMNQAGVGLGQAPFLVQWSMRHFGPSVGLPVWQAAQQRDLHSVVGRLPILWLTHAGQMRIKLDVPEALACEPIPEISRDYFGNLRPKDAPPTVGPFQDPKRFGQDEEEGVFLHLWPLDRSRQLPAEALRLNRPHPELDEQEKASGKTY